MSRSTGERLATHAGLVIVFGALLYLLLSVNAIAPPPVAPTPIASRSASLPDAVTATPPVVPTPTAIPLSTAVVQTPAPARKFRIGLQVGHWRTDEVPEELEKLSTVEGVTWDGLDETVLNLHVAQQLADLLGDAGIQTDILPTTVPEGYSADLFLALHADAYDDSAMRGFKVARSTWSDNPERDDKFVEQLRKEFKGATGLPEHPDTITDAMTQYYAFNYSEFRHSISPTTPGAIIELGFLSNEEDRHILVEEQRLAVLGIANAILDFLGQ